MLRSFEDELTAEVFHGTYTHAVRKQIPPTILHEAQRKLDILNCANDLDSIEKIPSIRQEGIVRDAKGKYSIPLFESWRIAFRWNGIDAEDIELKS